MMRGTFANIRIRNNAASVRWDDAAFASYGSDVDL